MSVAETSPGFLDTSVGKKVVMAVTGIVLFGFVTVHMLGNLQAYMGREALNHYAEFLHTMVHGGGIWVFRGVMLAAVVLHGWAALSLTLANRAARPVGYRAQQYRAATFSSRTMRWTGVFLAFFVLYHLMHLTVGTCHPSFDRADPYHNFVTGFQQPLAAAIYVVAQVCLGIHMWHGVWSMTQTLGWSHPRYDTCRKRFAYVMAILVAGVNISFPVAVLAGVIHL
ncbi:succinate dehydrogenase cytochrome b subunit [Mesoterricola sediminis]|uniref:Succinate dehydrogenase n=1 Tax=Mesoterricola sediminis TaxID=2927980 RepID=A0AA48GPQ0_9BACT|nr:succinate dehydrogenase cytochrome b subunit [Mesoterricola sediminis]BDU76976.1 succinate dehydrogenase [Mesoterricola sediminis]